MCSRRFSHTGNKDYLEEADAFHSRQKQGAKEDKRRIDGVLEGTISFLPYSPFEPPPHPSLFL